MPPLAPLLAAGILLAAGDPPAVRVPEAYEIETADGETLRGPVELAPDGSLRVGAAGGSRSVPWPRVLEVRAVGVRPGLPPLRSAVVRTQRGDLLQGPLEPLPGDPGGARVRLGARGGFPLGTKTIRAIRFYRADRTPAMDVALDRALSDGGVRDLLLAVDEKGEVVSIPGALESFGPGSLKFRHADRTRDVSYDRLAAAVLAPAASPPPLPAGAARVFYRDGSTLAGAWRVAEGTAALEVEGAGTVPLETGEWLRILDLGGASTFLSDLPPARVEEGSALGEELPRLALDQGIAGGPLALRGRVYDKGLGLRPRADVRWGLGGRRARVLADAGIDDTGAPGSNAVLSIEADGRRVFGPETLRAGEPARRIDADVRGASTLRIVCGFGEGLPVRARVALGNARLLPEEERPAR